MQSSPRNWVLKALSPTLDPSDLRTMLGPHHPHPPDLDQTCVTDSLPACFSPGEFRDVLAQARQVTLSEHTGSSNTSSASLPCSPTSSTGSHCGFYSFVEDPTSTEAELNEAWMVSPERHAQLATLREDQDFRLQTYIRGRTPGNLFEQSNGDSPYEVHPSDADVVQEEEERRLRKEIIRSQAPKKSPAPKTPWRSPDSADAPDKLLDGFSLFFGQSSARADPDPGSPAKPGAVDSEQINFSAARQQFLKMEKEQLKAMLSPPGSPRTHSRTFQRDLRFSTQMDSSADRSSPGVPDRVYNELVWEATDQDSPGLSDRLHQNCSSSRTEPLVHHETPIEREIRIAQEREESLRRLRGLKLSDGRAEMIQIRTKSLPLLFNAPQTPTRPKEKNRVSFLIQQDRAQFNHSSALEPADRTVQTLNKDQPSSEQEERKDEAFLQPCCPHRHPEETELYISSRSSAPISRKTTENVTAPPGDGGPPAKPQLTAVDSVTSSQDNLSLPPSMSSPTPSVLPTPLPSPPWRGSLANRRIRGAAPESIQKEIEDDLRREQELQELRTSRGLSVFPDKQPDSLTQTGSLSSQTDSPREPRELSVWTKDKSPVCPAVRLPSLSNATPQPWGSIRPSPSNLLTQPSTPHLPALTPNASSHPQSSSSPLQRGLTKTLLEDFEERKLLLKLQENSYAGIQAIDDVNTEVLQATRVTRQKNKRALSWEAGVYANQYNQ